MTAGEERFDALVLHSTDMAVVFDSNGNIAYVTPSVESVSGYRPDELVGTTGLDFVHPDDLANGMKDVVQAMVVGETITREWRICRADGTWRWCEFTLTDLSDDPVIRGIVAHFRDVTDRHLADEALRDSERVFRRTVQLASDAFLAIGPDDCIAAWNPAAERIFGWPAEEAFGRKVAELIVPEEERELYLSRFDRAVAEDMPHLLEAPFEMIAMDRTGRRFPVEVHVVQVDLGGRFQFEAFVRDIGPRKELEARLVDHGFTDALTKLPNRTLLGDRLTLAVSRLARRSTGVAVLLLELDGLGALRDSIDEEAADQLIVRVAQRLSGIVRPSDTVARYGPDAFVIVAEDLKEPLEAIIIATRMLEVVVGSVALVGYDLEPGGSVGISYASSRDVSPEQLLRQADVAMNRARKGGGGCFAVYDEATSGPS
jgi:PAS domain S-box-containing protein/diguanylate cyclase (GGDEF)-like protein